MHIKVLFSDPITYVDPRTTIRVSTYLFPSCT